MMTISLIFIFGLFWGSFLNVLIDRLPNHETLWDRSKCDTCRHILGFFDLWPVFSFCAFLGKCRYCHHIIPRQHLVMEFLTGGIFAVAAYHLSKVDLNNPIVYLKYLILLSGLLIIGFQDYKYFLILDSVIYTIAVPVFLLNLFLGWNIWNLFGAALGAIIFFGLQYVLSKGAWLGAGDIWLGGLLGLAFAWPGVWRVVVLGYVIGAAVGIFLLMLKKKEMKSELPLGTFLSLAGIIYLLIK